LDVMTADEIYRRASGRRRYQSLRRQEAQLRRVRVIKLLESTGFSHGYQARIARALSVSQSTITRDIKAIRASHRQCSECGRIKSAFDL
jgi:DNA invertase Pin-like site-specific DNA recombinase